MRVFTLFTFLAISIPCFFAASIPVKDSGNPTIVLVPGAWHSPEHYSQLTDILKKAGYDIISRRNPSCGSLHPNDESAAHDAAALRNQILIPLMAAGKTVILAMHSYGGLPGAAAAKGLSQRERSAAGRSGGIIGLVFISAVLAHDGQSLLDLLPGHQFDPWVIEEVRISLNSVSETVSWELMRRVCKPNGQLGVRDPQKVFYGLVPDNVARDAISLLKPQSRASLSTPGGPPAWMDSAYDDRRAYWQSLDDQSIPSVAQEGMRQGTGVSWAVKRYPSDHSPFLSYPQALASWMVDEMRSWQGLSQINLTAAEVSLVSDFTEAHVPAALNSGTAATA